MANPSHEPPWRLKVAELRQAVSNAGFPRDSVLVPILEAVIALLEHDRTVVEEAKQYILAATYACNQHSRELARQSQERAAATDVLTAEVERLRVDIAALRVEIRTLRSSTTPASAPGPASDYRELVWAVKEVRNILKIVTSTGTSPQEIASRALIQGVTGLRRND